MLDRIVQGEVPRKHHIVFRDAGGALLHEECLTRDGFDGPYTILYHRDRPHTQRLATAAQLRRMAKARPYVPLHEVRRTYGLPGDEEVATAIVYDARPVDPVAAARLWDARDRKNKLLTRSAYDAMGGVSGALATHADEVIGVMTVAAQNTVRAIFQRLVTPERTRAIAELEELPVESSVQAARVIINSRTGSIVLNQSVTLNPCAIAHGNLAITISTTPVISQPQSAILGTYALVKRAVVVPLFLGGGAHVRGDVPRLTLEATAASGVKLKIARAIGEDAATLAAMARYCLAVGK